VLLPKVHYTRGYVKYNAQFVNAITEFVRFSQATLEIKIISHTHTIRVMIFATRGIEASTSNDLSRNTASEKNDQFICMT
jgi:broad specificity phosphatase PhoE